MKTITLTNTSQEQVQRLLKKLLALPFSAFLLMAILPLLIFGLFYFDLIKPATAEANADLEAAVGKVVTTSGVGTAFLVSPTKLMTARHVIEGLPVGSSVEVIFEQSDNQLSRTATIQWIAASASGTGEGGSVPLDYFLSDVALLALADPINEIAPLDLGTSADVANLDEVILIGYPGGDYSISEGNINNTQFKELELFKLDATSNPGNSGGPCILKNDNTVIGILVGGPSSSLIDGENIAMKIDDALNLMAADNIDVFD
ncbi:MAG: serine protease [Bacteroidota bacterium]